MAKVWTRIRQTIERHGSAALLSVVDAAGSVPRESGARIVLQPDGGFFGTIGGGRLEYEAIARRARALAAGRGAARFRDWPLGPNLGQCCGGMVSTLTETFDAADLAAVRRIEETEKVGSLRDRRAGSMRDGRIVRALASHAAAETGRTAFSRTSFPRTFRRSDHAGAAVWRRPCRPGRRAGAGAASLHGPLDRRPPGPVSPTCAAKCRRRLHRRPNSRTWHRHRATPWSSS